MPDTQQFLKPSKSIIALVGYPLSGKTEYAKTLKYPTIAMGDAIRKVCALSGKPCTDHNLGTVAALLRKKYGMDAIAKLTAIDINRIPGDCIIVDGIRSVEEVVYFKKYSTNFILIYLDVPFETRYKRLESRSRADDIVSRDFLKHRDDRENSFGLNQVVKMADKIIKVEN